MENMLCADLERIQKDRYEIISTMLKMKRVEIIAISKLD